MTVRNERLGPERLFKGLAPDHFLTGIGCIEKLVKVINLGVLEPAPARRSILLFKIGKECSNRGDLVSRRHQTGKSDAIKQ